MEGESSFSALAPPVFDGDNYQMWIVRMETYLETLDLLEAIEEDYEVSPLPANPTIAQIKVHKEKKNKKIKGKSLPICSCISDDLHANNIPQNSKGNLGLPQG